MSKHLTYVYECASPPSEALRYSARIRVEMLSAKQKVVMDWLPVSFYGATAHEAFGRAETHWREAIERERAKALNIAAGVAKRKANRDPDPIEAEAEMAVGMEPLR